LHLLVRTPAQLEAAISIRPAGITLDYLDLYGLKPSLERVRASGIEARVASPRVLKPGEDRIVDFLLSCDCQILVRSAGLLHALRDRSHHDLAGDFSLNAANLSGAEEFFALGLASLTPTHDLNAAQVADLGRAVGGERIEAILYQHLPVFHTEHCVFCRFLSTGTSYKDCGRPCEHHVVALRDDAGRAHPVPGGRRTLRQRGFRGGSGAPHAIPMTGVPPAWRGSARSWRTKRGRGRRISRHFSGALAVRLPAQVLGRHY